MQITPNPIYENLNAAVALVLNISSAGSPLDLVMITIHVAFWESMDKQKRIFRCCDYFYRSTLDVGAASVTLARAFPTFLEPA